MVPRLLDIEFLPLKLAFKLLRLSETDGNFPSLGRKLSVPGMETFHPRDGNFPSVSELFTPSEINFKP